MVTTGLAHILTTAIRDEIDYVDDLSEEQKAILRGMSDGDLADAVEDVNPDFDWNDDTVRTVVHGEINRAAAVVFGRLV